MNLFLPLRRGPERAAATALRAEPAAAHADLGDQSPHAQEAAAARVPQLAVTPLQPHGARACHFREPGPSRTPSKSHFQGLLRQLEEHEKAVSNEVARLREENEHLRQKLAEHPEESPMAGSPSEPPVIALASSSSPGSKSAPFQVARERTPDELPSPPWARARSSAQGTVVGRERSQPSKVALVLAASMGLPGVGDMEQAERTEETQMRALASSAHHRALPSWSRNKAQERCMISPVSRFRLGWDFVAFTCLAVDLWSTPFELVFLSGMSNPPGFTIMNWTITFFFVADICLNFMTGFVDRDKLIVQFVPSIKKYLGFWFWIDLVATIPFDVLATLILQTVEHNILSMARLARIAKVLRVLKTLRFLKVLRAVRLVRNMGRAQSFVEFFQPLQYLLRLMQTLLVLCVAAHIHACLFALVQPNMAENSGDVNLALYSYYLCFRRAYNAITFGLVSPTSEDNMGVWTLEMVIASERILIALILGCYGVVKALSVFQEDANMNLVKSAAVRVFRLHQVSIETQISVMYSLHETREAQRMQRHFKSLLSDHLPDELRRTVSEELWAPHLKTLGLFSTMKSWNPDFISELTLLVREEVIASKTVLCKEGHASIAAYYIFKGRLMVVGSHYYGHLPDFTDGMWVEEMALVRPARRRSSTVVAPVLSTLMTVPTRSFHELISTLGLEAKFQEFREKRLDRGVCGRCGDVGDHFTHACPQAGCSGRPPKAALKKYASSRPQSLTEVGTALSLNAFLHAHRLTKLAPLLYARGVTTRKDLEALDFDALHQDLGDHQELRNQLSLLQALVQEQQEQALFQICDEQTSAQHLAFLSHYKHEAGTEAALMRAELERVLIEETHSPAHVFNTPFFLDSEDLSDLEELQDHVRRSHNLILLLTQEVLLRPWVLVEIVTAIENDVRVLLVEVNKRSNHFNFPDEGFYSRLLLGQVLDADGQALLRERGVELPHIERALREVFTKIALPYSPHRPESIRRAEIQAIYKQCNYKSGHETRAEATSLNVKEQKSNPSRI